MVAPIRLSELVDRAGGRLVDNKRIMETACRKVHDITQEVAQTTDMDLDGDMIPVTIVVDTMGIRAMKMLVALVSRISSSLFRWQVDVVWPMGQYQSIQRLG